MYCVTVLLNKVFLIINFKWQRYILLYLSKSTFVRWQRICWWDKGDRYFLWKRDLHFHITNVCICSDIKKSEYLHRVWYLCSWAGCTMVITTLFWGEIAMRWVFWGQPCSWGHNAAGAPVRLVIALVAYTHITGVTNISGEDWRRPVKEFKVVYLYKHNQI